MLPGSGLGADAMAGILPVRRRLRADWSEFEVQMETPLSAGWDRRRRDARTAEQQSLVAAGEAAHGRA